jgi:hypothetical protein
MILAASLALPCAAASGSEADVKAAAREMLGDDFEGAKIVGVRHNYIVSAPVATGRIRTIARFRSARHWLEGLSRPSWSPDGTEILCSFGGRCYLMNADGSNKRRIAKRHPVYAPKWWLDPETGERCIVFKTANGKHHYSEDTKNGELGQTYLCRLDGKTYTKLADFPCDGGLSLDGTHLGEAYGQLMIADLTAGKFYLLYGGAQACNPSMSPDDTYRIMHMYSGHQCFAIRDRQDNELWQIRLLPRTNKWQHARWSNHPNFCSVTAKFRDHYNVVIVRIEPKTPCVLYWFRADWRVPNLWLPSAVPPAARKTLSRKKTKALSDLEKRLIPVEKARPLYTDEAYLAKNGETLKAMAEIATELGRDFPETSAAATARELAAKYALPVEAPRPAKRSPEDTGPQEAKQPDPPATAAKAGGAS